MGTFGMVLLMILGVILILTALVLFCPFLVLFSVSDEELILKIKVLGISLRIPLGQKEDSEDEDRQAKAKRTAKDEKDSALKKFLEMRNTFTRIRAGLGKALAYLSKKITIKQLGVMGKFGLGDAAVTGVSYGMVEAFTGVVTGFLQQFFEFEKPVYHKLDMDYDNVVFQLQFAMQIETKPWYLVRGALIFYKHWKQS
ncbi:MAG: DUF2953 domain-containing protein [Ruminococcaceae bacterium]|nr:DUF2953 domain-containing protein [Oscillospiraceae bacterium]